MLESILIVPGYRLYPIETGAGVAQYGIIDELRKSWMVTVLIDESNVQQSELTELKSAWPEVELINWDDLKRDWEQSVKSDWGYRLKRKLGLHETKPVELGMEVPSELEDVWNNVSILYYQDPEWKGASLNRYLKNKKFDVIQTDLSCHMEIGAAIPKHIPSVHVCHELKHERLRSSAIHRGIVEEQYSQLHHKVMNREMALLGHFDHVITFSDEDAQSVSSGYTGQVSVSPFPILDGEFSQAKRERPARLIFLGPESHGPNREGLLWFLDNVYAKMSSPMSLHVIGKWTAESIAKYSSEQIIFEGYVKDLAPYFKDSIMIVPVRSGAGIRTKILQAMAQGAPVLSTSFAAMGIDVKHGTHLGFFEDIYDFEKGLQLLLKDDTRLQITSSAKSFVEEHFSQRVLGAKRSELLNTTLNKR